MNRYLWLLGVFVAALIAGFVGAVPIAALALVVSLLVILPLTLGVGAMLAGLAAAWIGNLLAPEGVRRDLLRIVGVSEAAAAVLAVLLLLLVFWLESLGTFAPPLFLPLLLLSVVVLAISATLATWRSPDRTPNPGRDALLTLGLLGLTAFVIIWAIALSFLLGQVGF